MRVFFSAGEASGDAYAAELAKRLARPGLTLEGMGGPKSQSAGIRLAVDSSSFGAMGILQSIKVGPRGLAGLLKVRAALAKGEPGLLIPIDFGFFNLRVCRIAKRLGWKVLYFIPPGSWRRGPQGKHLSELADEVVTPFPWSAEILAQQGVTARFFGHPLAQMIGEAPGEEHREGIALLPGSRAHEVDHTVGVMAEVLKGHPGPIWFGVASTVDPAKLEARWRELGGGPAHWLPSAREALKKARAAIVCSGTATLEAALCRCPMVVVYIGSRMMELEGRILKPKFDWISLPNILLQRGLLPELIQGEATPERIRTLLLPLESDTPERLAQMVGFEELASALQGQDCLDKTAALAAEMLESMRR